MNGTLDQIGQQRVSDIPHDQSAIGHANLAGTVSDFLGRWQRGVDSLTKEGQEIATRLTANVNAYRAVEQGLQDHITHVRGELVGTGTDPGIH